jgi:phosphatidylglycerol lysyltransferase
LHAPPWPAFLVGLEPPRIVALSHGHAIYNFQGLRTFTEKFDPVWLPKYLVYPGGLRLARVLADVSALIAGGYRKIFLK